jgi:hypothetical protein
MVRYEGERTGNLGARPAQDRRSVRLRGCASPSTMVAKNQSLNFCSRVSLAISERTFCPSARSRCQMLRPTITPRAPERIVCATASTVSAGGE